MAPAPKPELHKTIFQLHYKAELKFYGLLMPAAARLPEYPHWETSGLRVVLRDVEKHCSLAVGHNSITYEQDSPDYDMEQRNIGRALEELPSALEVESLTRLGFRRQYLIPVDMPFESLVSVMNVKLFSQEERLRALMPPRVDDLLYRVDAGDDAHKYHLTVGPLRKREIPVYVAYNREHHLKPDTGDDDFRAIAARYPDIAVLADIDMYQSGEQIPCNDAVTFAETARERVAELVSNLTEYMFERKVEQKQ